MSEQAPTHVIHLAQGNFPRRPWPITLSGSIVLSGMGDADGSALIGFAPQGVQEIAVTVTGAVANPESVVGLEPVFSDDDGFYGWGFLVEKFVEATPKEAESDG